MDNEKPNIVDIINNNNLKGSLYSTFKCSICGEKLIVQTIGNQLQFACKEYKYGYGDPTRKEQRCV